MGGEYKMHVMEGGIVMALDDDGGEMMVDFALSHGRDESVAAFLRWLDREIMAVEAEQAALKKRRSFRVLQGGVHVE